MTVTRPSRRSHEPVTSSGRPGEPDPELPARVVLRLGDGPLRELRGGVEQVLGVELPAEPLEDRETEGHVEGRADFLVDVGERRLADAGDPAPDDVVEGGDAPVAV